MKLKNFNKIFLAILLSSFSLLLLRIQEAYIIDSLLYFQFDAINFLLKNWASDFNSLVFFSLFIILLTIFFKKIDAIIIFFFSLIIILNGILTKFFLTNFDLLGSEIFIFSLKDIIFIIKTEKNSFDFNSLFMIFFLPCIFIILYKFFTKKINVNKPFQYIFLPVYLVFLFSIYQFYFSYPPTISNFKNGHQFTLNKNKLLFFLTDAIYKNQIENNKENVINIKQSIKIFQEANNRFHYIDPLYPLVYDNEYENVLGSYFKKSDTLKPNIVFLMIESLSSSFSGPKPSLGSFTPFLDSIIDHSLYWENFLSNAERTYGVLPNTISSAPYFDQFVQHPPYINHNSMIKELKKYDYYSSFNYGGWSNFSHREEFLNYHNIDTILADASFDTSLFEKHKATEDEWHWGYDDEALLQQYFINLKNYKEPYLSLILTVSMHSPYDVSKTYTLEKAKKYLGNISETQKKIIEAHPEKIRAIAFDDELIKLFFQEYAKRKDYNNTIFFIYGDHNIHALPERNEIDVFHVPFYIYSPLLTKTASFKAISTHKDILPSLFGLFEGNFNMTFQKEKHWQGFGLDTSKTFRSNSIMPFVISSNKYANFLNKEYFVVKNEVYKIDSTLNLKLEKNKEKIEKTMTLYNAYKDIENYMYNTDKLFKKD